MSDSLSPGPDLERRVLAALYERGLLRRRGPHARAVAALAAAAALVGIGFGVGTWRAQTTIPREPGRLFVLLLTVDAGAAGATAATPGAVVEEYRAWAVGLHQQGRLVAAEKLKAAAQVLGPGPGDGTRVGGYFVIRAASHEEALAVARSHPHLRRGGTITLREVDPV